MFTRSCRAALAVLVALGSSGCIVAVIRDPSTSNVVVRSSRLSERDVIPQLDSALASFCRYYDYHRDPTPSARVRMMRSAPPEIYVARYSARFTLLGIGGTPHHYIERPSTIDIYWRPDGRLRLFYEGSDDPRSSSNPVVNDLKAALAARFGEGALEFRHAPGQWQLVEMGGS